LHLRQAERGRGIISRSKPESGYELRVDFEEDPTLVQLRTLPHCTLDYGTYELVLVGLEGTHLLSLVPLQGVVHWPVLLRTSHTSRERPRRVWGYGGQRRLPQSQLCPLSAGVNELDELPDLRSGAGSCFPPRTSFQYSGWYVPLLS